MHKHTACATPWLAVSVSALRPLRGVPLPARTLLQDADSKVWKGLFISPPLLWPVFCGVKVRIWSVEGSSVWVNEFMIFICVFFQFRGVQAQPWTGKIFKLATNRFCVCRLFLRVLILSPWFQPGNNWCFSTGFYVFVFLNCSSGRTMCVTSILSTTCLPRERLRWVPCMSAQMFLCVH